MEGPPRMRALCCIWPMKKNDSGLILDTTACAAAYGEHGDSQGKLEGDPAAAASSRGGLPDASSSNGGLGNFIFVTVDRSNNTTAHRSQQAVLSNRSGPALPLCLGSDASRRPRAPLLLLIFRRATVCLPDPETDVVPVIDYVTDDTTDDPAFAAEQSGKHPALLNIPISPIHFSLMLALEIAAATTLPILTHSLILYHDIVTYLFILNCLV
ncbi:uncharacterized protein [Triticum aestivum]|uniref:uncharacterized protein isoform X2 n=1 Tax=Triticum aestivum TaxID=4565 RepID=UPI001D01697A|nr:uncharacterized protein LOC123162850 isoform X2 [Triticum aestivum]